MNATVNIGKVNLDRKIKLKNEVDFVEEQNYITQGVLALIPSRSSFTTLPAVAAAPPKLSTQGRRPKS